MNDAELSKKVIELVGGGGNIIVAFNCYTRLRINVRNFDLVKVPELQKLEGVIGVVTSGIQVQVIVGPGRAAKLTSVVNQRLEAEIFNRQQEESAEAAAAHAIAEQSDKKYLKNKENFRGKLNGNFNSVMKKVAGIFVPIIPAFIACGLLLAILEIIKIYVEGFTDTSFGIILNVVSSSVFSILSVIVGFNACKEFGGDGILGACLGGILSSPLLGDAETPLVIGPFTIYAGLGGVIAVLMVAISAAYFEKLIRKFMPDMLDSFLTPLITLIVMSVAGLFLLMPLGGYISQGIAIAVEAIVKNVPILLGLVPMFYLFLVLFGVHHGLIPISQALIDDYMKQHGTTVGWAPIVPVQLMAGAAEVGAAIYVLMKTRDKKLKKTIKHALPIGILGIDEPLIWGMTFTHKRLFISAGLGGAIAGAVVASLNIMANVPETTGIQAALLCGVDINKKWQYALCFILAIALGFIFAALIGFKDTIETTDPATGKVKTEVYETSIAKKLYDQYRAKHPKKVKSEVKTTHD
ncbi:MAG: PTS transporter subunit EIIC [Bacilli bacterium]|nr:PTS transporter subunit EIIC [Bacilli bacterium]